MFQPMIGMCAYLVPKLLSVIVLNLKIHRIA